MLIIWLCEDSKNIVNNGILGKSVLGFCEFLWPKVWDSRLLAALVNIRWTGPPTLFPCFCRRWAQSSQRQRNPPGSDRLLCANADLCAIFEDIDGVKKPDLRLVWQIMQGPRTHLFCNTLTLNNLGKISVRGPNF